MLTIYSRLFKVSDITANIWPVRTFSIMLTAAREHARDTGEITYIVENGQPIVVVSPRDGSASIYI